ncbi:hypothetical protein BGZ76_007969, partial [Entomortierella beljakovae]
TQSPSISASGASTPTSGTEQKRRRKSEDVEVVAKRLKTGRQLWDDMHKYLLSHVQVTLPPRLYPDEQQNLAGRFKKTNSTIPFSGSKRVDMRLDFCPTEMGKKLNK